MSKGCFVVVVGIIGNHTAFVVFFVELSGIFGDPPNSSLWLPEWARSSPHCSEILVYNFS
jgi:hypothetical protein